jgi:hypothetical protein
LEVLPDTDVRLKNGSAALSRAPATGTGALDPGEAEERTHVSRRTLWLVFAGVAVFNLALLAPFNYADDGNAMFALADSLARHQTLTVPCPHGAAALGNVQAVRHGGVCYSNFYPLLSFLLVPFVLVGREIGTLAGVSPLYTAKVVALVLPALAQAGAAALTVAIAAKLGASRRGAVAAACAFALGTEALTYSRTLYAEALQAFLVALAVWGITEGSRRRRQLGYVALGFAVLAKPQMVVVGPGLALALVLARRSWRPVIPIAIATVTASLVYFAYNAARFGDPLKFGGRDRMLQLHWFTPGRLLDGLAVLIISPGRGLLWFSPVAILGAFVLWRRRRTPVAAAALGASLAILLLSMAHPGGWQDWGTRYLVPTLPLVCAGVGLLRGRQATFAIALVAVALVNQIPTTVAFTDRYFAEAREQQATTHDLRWKRFAVTDMWVTAAHQVRDARHTDVRKIVANAGGQRSKTVAGEPVLHVVALWWWVLPAVHVSRWLGAMTCLLALLVAGRLLWRASGGGSLPRAGPAVELTGAAPEPR